MAATQASSGGGWRRHSASRPRRRCTGQRAATAAAGGRGEARHAGIAHRPRRPGTADGALARQVVEPGGKGASRAAHRLNILAVHARFSAEPAADHRSRGRRALGRHIRGAGSPWLHEEVGRRMEERLQWIKARPRHWVDWAPLRGGLQAHALVARRYRGSAAYVIEPEAALTEPTPGCAGPAVVAHARPGARAALRYAAGPGGVDLLWANMALHMAADPQALIAQWHRLLAIDGFLMFSCLGPGHPARTARAVPCAGLAAGRPRVHRHARLGRHAGAAGFAEPVMDMERIVLTWTTPGAALAELRELGRNLHPGRFAGLRGRRWQAQLARGLEALAVPAATGGARIAMTFEIVYGHAFKPAPRVAVAPRSARVAGRDARDAAAGRRPERRSPEQARNDPLQSRGCVNHRGMVPVDDGPFRLWPGGRNALIMPNRPCRIPCSVSPPFPARASTGF